MEPGVEPQSLEYEEDPYFSLPDCGATPSFDVEVDDEEVTSYRNGWPGDDELDALALAPPGPRAPSPSADAALVVETEFVVDNKKRRLRIFRKRLRDVRVTFQDLSKPYMARISSNSNYKKFLGITPETQEKAAQATPDLSTPDSERPITPASELDGLTLEEQEQLRAEWSRELARVEDEIATLRTVLQSKIRQSSELKRKLGITFLKEVTDDINQGLKNVKESQVYQSVETHVGQITKAVVEAPVYQKTESVIKNTSSTIFGGISSKLGQMRNSESFRSIEERVGSAYENVKGKVVSRSNSMQSFDGAATPSAPLSPSIPENKVLP